VGGWGGGGVVGDDVEWRGGTVIGGTYIRCTHIVTSGSGRCIYLVYTFS